MHLAATHSLLSEEETPKENKAVFDSKNLGESRPSNLTKNKSFYGEQLPEDFDDDVTEVGNEPSKSKKQTAKKSINSLGQDTQDLDDLLEKKKGGFLTFVSWLFMCVILSTTLIGQYIYFNFDHLAQSKWRNEVIQLCDYIGCKVPTTNNTIKSLNITKFQATQEGDLVKVIFILNNPQSKSIEYPNLLVQVFDKNNLLLGDQIFNSTEYLPSQIQTESKMRGNVNIKGDLLLKDLGEQAVRYQLLLAPKP